MDIHSAPFVANPQSSFHSLRGTPMSRGLPRKRVGESFQRKVTLNIYLSLRLLTALKSRQNPPPSTEGGKSLHIQTARQIKISSPFERTHTVRPYGVGANIPRESFLSACGFVGKYSYIQIYIIILPLLLDDFRDL